MNDSISPSEVLDAMERYGGGFVKALAWAWRRADSENDARLHGAFGHYWAEYEKVAMQDAARRAERIGGAA